MFDTLSNLNSYPQQQKLFELWNDAQKQWWDNYFRMFSSATLLSGIQSAQVWQNNLKLLQESIGLGFSLQQQSGAVIAESFGKLEPASKIPALAEAVEALKSEPLKPIKLEINAEVSHSKTLSQEDILAFAYASGDVNPVHLDADYASKSRFKKPIAHGILTAGFISAVIGTMLPGPGAIYLSQNLNFKYPVYIGDTITSTVKVIAKHPTHEIYTLETICKNQAGKVVISGEAVIMFESVV
ncbi:MAG: MaoC family dehydratase [Deinococcales bacterium]